MSVEVNLKINTVEAEAKLRLLETRARAVTSALTLADRTGLPSSRPGVNILGAVERPGSTIINPNSPLGQVKSTHSMPTEVTAAALLTAGAVAGGLSGSRTTEMPRAQARALQTHLNLRKAGSMPGDIQFEYPAGYDSAIPTSRMGESMMRAGYRTGRRLNYSGTDLTSSGIPRPSGQDLFEDEVYGINRRYMNRVSTYHKMSLSPGRMAARFIGIRPGAIAEAFPTVTNIGRMAMSKAGAALTLAVAGNALGRGFSEARRNALDNDRLNPGSFSYASMAEEGVKAGARQVRDTVKSALAIGLNIASVPLEGALQYGRIALGELLYGNKDAISQADVSRAVQEGIDYYSGGGIEAERQKALSRKRDIWSAGLVATRFKAIEFSNKISHNQALRALQIGFSYGTGADIENRIRNEIQEKVITKSLREYRRTNPEPTMNDMLGKKD